MSKDIDLDVLNYSADIVRVEPSPYGNPNTKIKLKMAQSKINSVGQAIQDREGRIQKELVDIKPPVQVPGTGYVYVVRHKKDGTGLNTGLDILVDNPYHDEEAYFPVWGETILKGRTKASLQNILEYKHKKDLNYYRADLSDKIYASTKEFEQPFFATRNADITFTGNVLFLNLKNPLHEVYYHVLRASSICANSLADLDNGRNPDAVYYMVDEAEVKRHEVGEIQIDTTTGQMLEELRQHGDSLCKVARAMGNSDRDLDPNGAFKWIYKQVKDTNKGKPNIAEYNNLKKYYELFKDASRREILYANADVQDLLMYNVIRERDSKYYWVKPETDTSPVETFEWKSKEKLVKDFILAPEYQEEVELVMSILKSRIKAS